ncbi:MAG: hypothetical protein ACLGHN_09365 [Bacteriovoracia bacterium]
MDSKQHYFMTLTALFFLGLLVAKPGSSFQPPDEKRECKWNKGKLECEHKNPEYHLNYRAIQYHYK